MSAPTDTVLVAAAVVEHEGRILLTRRMEGSHLAGMWEFPGGKIEPGEDPEATVRRECAEECAIDVVVDDILDVTFHAYAEKSVLLLFYRCRLGARRSVQHVGVADHRWVLPVELRDHAMPPPDQLVIRKLGG